jgi:uncharacterized phage-associated protein
VPGPNNGRPHPGATLHDLEMAKTVNAVDVAAYILNKAGQIEQLKLHKLLYYCQAASLAWHDKPLFNDPIEAWINGPVVPTIWNLHRYEYKIEKEETGKPWSLDSDDRLTVDSILKAYSHLPAYQLVQLTHEERPWQEARRGLHPNERGMATISVEAMRTFYSREWA